MRGFPKHLNCKQDYLNMLDEYPELTRAALQQLLNEADGWVLTGKLAEEETGVSDDTHEVREVLDDEGNVAERYQFEYTVDPGSKLVRLGFDKEEVEGMINA